jgi:hypothetical protein
LGYFSIYEAIQVREVSVNGHIGARLEVVSELLLAVTISLVQVAVVEDLSSVGKNFKDQGAFAGGGIQETVMSALPPPFKGRFFSISANIQFVADYRIVLDQLGGKKGWSVKPHLTHRAYHTTHGVVFVLGIEILALGTGGIMDCPKATRIAFTQNHIPRRRRGMVAIAPVLECEIFTRLPHDTVQEANGHISD